MPIPPLNTDQPAAVCCEQWFSVAESLVNVAGQAVADCLGSHCAGFRFYVSHGEPIGPGDYLAAWLASVEPVPTATGAITQYGAMPYRMTFGVVVTLTGYPGIRYADGGKISTVPSAAEYMHGSYFTYGAGERMWRTVANEAVKGKAGTVFGRCANVAVGPLVPQPPENYSARWGMFVAADL